MTDSVQTALTALLTNPQSSELLKKLISNDDSTESITFPKPERVISEKEKELDTKIQILKQLKPLFGTDTCDKIDTLINALNIAKIICGASQN